MTLENYVRGLTEFIKNNPQLKDCIVIYAKDEEGNGFEKVFYTPTKGYYEDRNFIEKDNFNAWSLNEEDINAVCIN